MPTPTRRRSRPASRRESMAPLREEVRQILSELHGLSQPHDLAETNGRCEQERVVARLVELNTPLVRYVARRFRATQEPFDDLMQVGMMGLIKAIRRFDCDRGVEFAAFAIPTIEGEIKRYFRDSTWSLHVPRRLREIQTSIWQKREELNQQLGRAAKDDEIADALGVETEEVRQASYAARAYCAGSLDSVMTEQGSRHEPHSDDERRFDQSDIRVFLSPALRRLPKRQREILELRFVEDKTQTEIARAVGISQMHVSRLLASTLNELRSSLAASRINDLASQV